MLIANMRAESYIVIYNIWVIRRVFPIYNVNQLHHFLSKFFFMFSNCTPFYHQLTATNDEFFDPFSSPTSTSVNTTTFSNSFTNIQTVAAPVFHPFASSPSKKIQLRESIQLKESAECLQASAAYMNEIELFFQELSNTSTPSPSFQYDLPPLNCFNTNIAPTADFDRIIKNPSIDPSIFNFQDEEIDQEQEESCGDESADDSLEYTRLSSQSTSGYDSTRSKTPKFYSRSGQIADPNRGPCCNCGSTLTCYWRKLKGQYHCNACTLFFKRNKFHRSVNEVDKPIKRRIRKSKYSTA